MNTDVNRRQRRTRRRTGGGACRPWVASIGERARFNRFGRMVDHRWYGSGASADRDRYTYGYDRASNRLYRKNTLTTGRDEFYGYDQVNRLVEFARGELNANKDGIMGTAAKAEEWGLDTTGNWDAFLQKTAGTTDLNQTRDHNPVNEITAITAATGTDWADPAHDRNGNMTTIPKPANLAEGLTATYDAWNRLVEVKDGETVIARYEYDGLNRRIKSHIDSGAPSNPSGIDTYVHYYHNSAWQILETRQSDTPSAQPETLQPKHQFVWSQRYIDAAVLRDENTGANGLCDDDRLYYLNDANFNVTALLDTAGDALERYVYSPYGVGTIYDATWTDTRSASSYGNVTLYTGRELDPDTGLYYYRNRYYSAELGSFVSRDPLGEVDGPSLYLYMLNAPTVATDPSGRSASLDEHCLPSMYAVCIALVKALRGNTCGALEAFCSHIGRHPGKFNKNWLKMCLSLHNAVCWGRGKSHHISKDTLRQACKDLYG